MVAKPLYRVSTPQNLVETNLIALHPFSTREAHSNVWSKEEARQDDLLIVGHITLELLDNTVWRDMQMKVLESLCTSVVLILILASLSVYSTEH